MFPFPLAAVLPVAEGFSVAGNGHHVSVDPAEMCGLACHLDDAAGDVGAEGHFVVGAGDESRFVVDAGDDGHFSAAVGDERHFVVGAGDEGPFVVGAVCEGQSAAGAVYEAQFAAGPGDEVQLRVGAGARAGDEDLVAAPRTDAELRLHGFWYIAYCCRHEHQNHSFPPVLRPAHSGNWNHSQLTHEVVLTSCM